MTNKTQIKILNLNELRFLDSIPTIHEEIMIVMPAKYFSKTSLYMGV